MQYQPTLSAQAVEDAIEDRILSGHYPLGSSLPSVRVLANELGTSPSTVSRALQGLERRGRVSVTDRRGASVASTLPRGSGPDERTAEVLRGVAVRWRLSGRSAEEFKALVAAVIGEAFQPPHTVCFVECNPVDLAAMAGRIRRETEIRVEPLLLSDLRDEPARVKGATVLTPFFHLAETRSIVGIDVDVVPLNIVPSADTMRELSEIPRGVPVVAVGKDDRATQQITGLASHYTLTQVVGVSLADPARVASLVEDAGVVVVTNATELPPAIRAKVRRLLIVAFDVESSALEAVRSALLAAEVEAPG